MRHKIPSGRRSSLRLAAACLITLAMLSSCATSIVGKPMARAKPQLQEKQYVSFDGDRLGYNKWLPSNEQPKTVIIGVHGISGHAGDYNNLGKYLQKHSPDTALYAAETRGQGMDPKVERRGDVRRAGEWYKDLYTFTDLVRKVHPGARVVWFGESMGSLIVMHAYSHTPPGSEKPDALIISSPIVDVRSKLPAWKLMAVRVSAFLLPTIRISLESLSNGDRPQVTEDDIHPQQAAKNPWYIPRYTLRLLLKLGDLADEMPEEARQIRCPILVMHGGRDIFTSEQSVKNFYRQLPDSTPRSRKFYPDAYHLLMYAVQRKKIFKDVTDWLGRLK